VNVTPVTASHVNVGLDVVSAGPGEVVLPGETTTGAGSDAVPGVVKYRYVLGGPETLPLTKRRFQTNWSPAPRAVGGVKLVAVLAIW
jgi:hypothetical protein